jgi:hypothetical protein
LSSSIRRRRDRARQHLRVLAADDFSAALEGSSREDVSSSSTVLQHRERKGLIDILHAERAEWGEERHSLLDRIQHPQVLQPTRDTPAAPAIDPEPDVLAMVGGVFNDAPPKE